MVDTIIKIGKGSIVQHGHHNDRVYLMKLHPADTSFIANYLIQLAQEQHYTKIFTKIPKSVAPLFLAEGYQQEAYIPKCYKGEEDALFMAKFVNPPMVNKEDIGNLRTLSSILSSKEKKQTPDLEESCYDFRELKKEDTPAMVKLFQDVFPTYPFPVYDPAYLASTMEDSILYYGAFENNKLVAVSSAEICLEQYNAEMTDFATSPSHTGRGLATQLLELMEKEMKAKGVITLFTIARLCSIPMNRTFTRLGYHYTGTLKSNTQIGGSIESMNVYYKHLLE